jgi:aspartate aminotransferase-like enzyme
MQAYEQGGHAYHATMPSDSLARFNEVMKETQAYGFDKVFDGYDAGRRDFVPDP